MAGRIKAIQTYRPRIELGSQVENDELVDFIAFRTGLNDSMTGGVLSELHEAVIFYNKQG